MNNNPTTLSKLLNGINSTLNIANKVMPLYKETKPIIKTVTNTYKNIKNNKSDFSNIIKFMKYKTIKKEMKKNSSNLNDNKKLITNTNYDNSNNPKFFI